MADSSQVSTSEPKRNRMVDSVGEKAQEVLYVYRQPMF